MKLSFEQTLIEVWRQALVENATVVELDGKRYPVRRTPKRGLRQVDFVFDDKGIRGLEQNPETKSERADSFDYPLIAGRNIRHNGGSTKIAERGNKRWKNFRRS